MPKTVKIIIWTLLLAFFCFGGWLYFDLAISNVKIFSVVVGIIAVCVAGQIILPKVLLKGAENPGLEKTIRLVILIIMMIAISYAMRFY